MATKLYDMAVSTGSWTGNDGKEHKNWLKIGRVMKSDKGTAYIMLNTSFNPAGVPHKEGDDCISVALFPPRDKEQNNQSAQENNNYSYRSNTPPNDWQPDDDNIPF